MKNSEYNTENKNVLFTLSRRMHRITMTHAKMQIQETGTMNAMIQAQILTVMIRRNLKKAATTIQAVQEAAEAQQQIARYTIFSNYKLLGVTILALKAVQDR